MERTLWAFFLGLLCLLLFLLGLVGLLGMTSYQTSPWGFYPFPSSFLRSLCLISFNLTFLLPLIVLVGLLVAISCHASLVGFISFFLSSLGFCGPFAPILLFHSFLLYFCLLLSLSIVGPFFIYFFYLFYIIKNRYQNSAPLSILIVFAIHM